MTNCDVHPGPHATDDLIRLGDQFDVPVFVRHSTPMAPQSRPYPGSIRGAARTWPTTGLPGNGSYRIPTTWRAILLSAVTVGRDVTPWLSAVPHLATQEILSRCSPLRAYLRRVNVGSDRHPQYVLVPNEVYQRGAESSAKGAFGYRIGMTMAEWLCWGHLGMSPSTHAESTCPPDVDPSKWLETASKPDLLGTHTLEPKNWFVEAKGRQRLGLTHLRKGAAQLDLDALVAGPHRRVLCGTNIGEPVFMTLDIDTRDTGYGNAYPTDPNPLAGPDPAVDDEAMYRLARASMLIYLVLRSTEATAVIAVGRSADRRAAGRQDQDPGPVSLLERDPTTQLLRERLRGRQFDRAQFVREEGIDMLTAVVPGTGMTVGLSRRMYAACQAIHEHQRGIVTLVEEEMADAPTDATYDPEADQPTGAPPGTGAFPDEFEALQSDQAAEGLMLDLPPDVWGVPYAVREVREDPWTREQRVFRRREREFHFQIIDDARGRFDRARDQSWNMLTDREAPVAVDVAPNILEASTADMYLAVDQAAVV